MAEISQRDLHTDLSAALRAVEAGAEYTVAVRGRPVATLGPHRARQWVAADDVRDLLRTPTDPGLLEDVRTYDLDADLDHDPWDRG